MKKLLFVAAMILQAVVLNAEEIEIGGINYRLFDGDKAEVIGKQYGYDGDIIIPSSVQYNSVDYSVTQIRRQAFYNNKALTSITIPNSISFIGTDAFYGCLNLSAVYICDLAAWCRIKFGGSVFGNANPLVSAHHLYLNGEEIRELVIPEGITVINAWAFGGCSEITSVTIPSSVVEIQDLAFYECNKLNKVEIDDLTAWCKIKFSQGNVFGLNSNPLTIAGHLYINGEELTDFVLPNDVNEINYFVFSGCLSLKSVTIHEGVPVIGTKAFGGCRNLETLKLPSSLTRIESDAFLECKALKAIEIPENVTYIGGYAFVGCEKLETVNIPNSVTVIDEYAFSGCSGLQSVRMSDNLLSISNDLFSGCSNLQSINIPNTVSRIGSSAFYGCSSLQSISLSNNVTDIAWSAFSYCSSLKSIIIPEKVTNIRDRAFEGCSSIEAVDMSNADNLSIIWRYAFKDCSQLTTVIFPKSLDEIGEGAFSGCTSIQKMVCNNESIPFTGSNVFSGSNIGNATLYVPIVSLELYKATEPWMSFGDIQPIASESSSDGIRHITSNDIRITSEGGIIDIIGVDDGKIVNIYSSSGQIMNTTVSKGGQARIAANMTIGNIAIVCIGSQNYKILVK